MKALILAGGEPEGTPFQRNKSLTLLNGKPMIYYVVEAMNRAALVEELVVIGPKDELEPLLGNQAGLILPQRGDLVTHIMMGLDHFKAEPQVLIATADIPLIQPDQIDDLIRAGQQAQADLYYPIVEKDVCLAQYPDLQRTYVSLKEGCFTGGNLFLAAPAALEQVQHLAAPLVAYRKNPLKMCGLLGAKLVFKLLAGTLTLEEVERTLEQRFQVRGKAAILPYPQVCQDLDREQEIEKFEAHLKRLY